MLVTKQHKEQPPGDSLRCDGCGGASFFKSPISDPKTALTYNLQRCRDCGHIRWLDQPGTESKG